MSDEFKVEEIHVKRWSKELLTRYYLTDECGEDLGYVQEKEVRRGTDTYYDRHRMCKGDDFSVETTHTVTDESVLGAISGTNLNGNSYIDTYLLRQHIETDVLNQIKGKWKTQHQEATLIVVNQA